MKETYAKKYSANLEHILVLKMLAEKFRLNLSQKLKGIFCWTKNIGKLFLHAFQNIAYPLAQKPKVANFGGKWRGPASLLTGPILGL